MCQHPSMRLPRQCKAAVSVTVEPWATEQMLFIAFLLRGSIFILKILDTISQVGDVGCFQFSIYLSANIFYQYLCIYLFIFGNYLIVPVQAMVVILSLLAHPLLPLPGNFLRVGSNAAAMPKVFLPPESKGQNSLLQNIATVQWPRFTWVWVRPQYWSKSWWLGDALFALVATLLAFDFSHNSRAAASSSTSYYEEPIASTENTYVVEPRENKTSEEVNKNVSDCVGSPQQSEYEVGDNSWELTMLCRYQSWGAPSPRQNMSFFSLLPLTNRLDEQLLPSLHNPCSEMLPSIPLHTTAARFGHTDQSSGWFWYCNQAHSFRAHVLCSLFKCMIGIWKKLDPFP